MSRYSLYAVSTAALTALIGCSAAPAAAPSRANNQSPTVAGGAPTLGTAAGRGTTTGPIIGAAGSGNGVQGPATPVAGTAAPAGPTTPPAMTPVTPTAGMQPTAAAPPPLSPFNGPLDGDPSKPMVDIPGLKCGPLAGGFGATPQTVKITNRDVVVGYPCAHEGAAVTFFMFLHGTLDDAQKVPFTMNAFAIHKLIDSHNVVMAVPKAIGNQWGNGDNGADLPHLYETIDWIYTTFGSKFNIRTMWMQGGSWGAAYLANFACDAKLTDRLRGIQLVVGGGCPRCSDRLSCIVAQQEKEKGMGMMLTPEQRTMYSDGANIAPYATKHGCDAKVGPMLVGNVNYWSWPSCDPGWVHSYYMGPGEHADAWDPAAVLKMTEEMKSTEM